jgi:hypothetical protein
MDDEGRAVGGMLGKGNRSTWRKPAPALLCPPQILHDLTPGSNPRRRGGKPETNSLSYGTAQSLPFTDRSGARAIIPKHLEANSEYYQ